MKFTLIALPIKSVGNQLPNLGAIAIAQKVRDLGHEVNLIDAIRYRLLNEDIVKEVDRIKPDLIGLSGIITSYYYFEPLVTILKKYFSKVPLVVGGGITCVTDLIEKYTEVDYLIKGEGEIAITELILRLSSGQKLGGGDIPGLFVRTGKGFSSPAVEQSYPDISNISFPAYDLYDMDYYIESSTKNAYRFLKLYPEIQNKVGPAVRFFPVTITRGCPYSCSFCYRLIKKFRHPTIDNAIAHFQMIKERYGCSGISLLDELVVVDKAWFLEFCDALAGKVPGLHIFSGSGRANLLTPEIISHAKKAGFLRFGCGIESGSQTILNNLHKQVTVRQNYDAIKLVKNSGMMATCNFIFGSPGENKKTLRETENFIMETLDPRDYAVNLTVAYPGAPLFNYAIEKGILKKEEIHDYVLNIGFGNYPLNFSEFSSGDKLWGEVNLMQFRLKARFAWRTRDYSLLVDIALKHLMKEALYLLHKITPGAAQLLRSTYDNMRLRSFNRKLRGSLKDDSKK